MARLAEYYDLRIRIRVVFALDAPLQLQHHWACGVYYLYVVAACHLVSLGRFAVGTQQHLHVVKSLQLVVVNGYKSHAAQAFTLHSVVHYVAQAV